MDSSSPHGNASRPAETDCCRQSRLYRRSFQFPQAVVDAIKETRPKTPRLYFTVGPLILVLSLVKVHAKVRFDSRAKPPRLICRFDVQPVARTIAERRQRRGGRRGLLLHLDLLIF